VSELTMVPSDARVLAQPVTKGKGAVNPVFRLSSGAPACANLLLGSYVVDPRACRCDQDRMTRKVMPRSFHKQVPESCIVTLPCLQVL
jgi:hypothetical protein